jgi:hypothetical protein
MTCLKATDGLALGLSVRNLGEFGKRVGLSGLECRFRCCVVVWFGEDERRTCHLSFSLRLEIGQVEVPRLLQVRGVRIGIPHQSHALLIVIQYLIVLRELAGPLQKVSLEIVNLEELYVVWF